MVSSVSNVLSGSYASFSAARQAAFQKADADGTGGLSLEEFQALGPKDGKKVDGATSVEDLFSQIDTDGNGEVTQTELDAKAKADFASRMQQGGALSGANLLQASASGSPDQDFLTKADTDGDGVLSLDEFKAAKPADAPEDISSEDIFNQLDSDGDGSITLSELETNRPQGGPGGPPPGPPPGGDQADASSTSSTTSSNVLDSVASSSGSGGASSGSDDDETYDALDTNKDGFVSASEKAAGEATSSLKQATSELNKLVSQTLKTLLGAQELLAA